MTTSPDPSGTAAPDPSAGIQQDVAALGGALDAIQQHIANLEAQISANPSAPVSSLDLTALKGSLDALVQHANTLEAPVPEPAPSGSGAAPAGSGGAVDPTPGVQPPATP